MTDRIDVVVVGAGVVGLAVARALAQSGRSVIAIERHRRVGEETSSRNSGVIHSGIYYPQGSLKARLCVRGRGLLYAYCAEKGVAHRRCGKLIVAQERELPALDGLHEAARNNGVHDLERLDAERVRQLEPQLRCAGGLWCPSTGIVDPHELMTALHGDLDAAGGNVAFGTELASASARAGGWELTLQSGIDSTLLDCELLVNAAGLHAVELLERIAGYPRDRIPQRFYAKGNYFSLRGRSPFTHLVYPMPVPGGLGVHATLDLAGRVRFGPDVEWVERPDEYQVSAARAAGFYEAIRVYWPGLADAALEPAYAGIRPKLVGAGVAAADFHVDLPARHGVAGLVNLLGIESPGLTSALALGEYVTGQVSAG
ncbi:MAG TPA: NAD(P)/FAD-dependent oxidoreductase [Steroidobacteraceae bacterium]|nr:NAD(P)/FAD-dependent oxidoreductase [Steroidobacteraceae bacterium]